MSEERKENVKQNIYLPLREWIKGNPQIDNNMKIELIDIFHDAIKNTIDECYGKMKETLSKRDKHEK